MCKVIAVANQKGGVGKTVTSVNLGIGLAREGKNVLIIDADPQGSLTISLGYLEPDQMEYSLATAMLKLINDEPVMVSEGVLHHQEGADILPGNIELSGLEADRQIFYSIKGERIRSKAEKIIADELMANYIPYRYEYPLQLKVGNQTKIFRPDFIALNVRTQREYILEHLGMMNKYGYNNSSIGKIGVYEKNGYMLSKNMLITHETYDTPIDIVVLRQYIEEYLL